MLTGTVSDHQAPPKHHPGQWLSLSWPPLAGLLIYLVICLPLLNALALDYSTLLRNLELVNYDTYVVDPAWVTWGVAVLKLGSLPLVLLVLAAALYGLAARRAGRTSPVAALGPWTRAGLFVGVMVPFLLFCVPLAVALAVGLAVEAFWWIQWYGNRAPIMELITYKLPPLLAVGPALAGAVAAYLSLRRKRQGPRWSFPVRLALAGVHVTVIMVLLAATPLAAASLLHTSRFALRAGTASTFQETCGQCHAPTRPLHLVKTPEEWQHLVNKMKVANKAPLEPKLQAEITDFLVGMRSFPHSWTFRTRCLRCHESSGRTWNNRTPEEWALVVDRVARTSPHYYQPAVTRQIKQHLAAEFSGPMSDRKDPEGPGSPARVLGLVKACTGCHYLSRASEQFSTANKEAVAAMVRRMGQRMSPRPDDQELRRLAETYRWMVATPDRLPRLVPHDRPEREGDLPW